MIEKKAILTYVDPYMLGMIRDLATNNNMIESEAIESILRVFFIKDELVEHMLINQTLTEQLEALESKLQQVTKANQVYGEALESLERKVNLLEDAWYSGKIDGRIESLSEDVDKLLEDVKHLIEEE